MVDTPLYLSFSYKYSELNEKLEDEKGKYAFLEPLPYGVENIEVPYEEKMLIS